METVEYMWVNIRGMLMAPAKIPEREGSISPSSFYGQLPDYYCSSLKLGVRGEYLMYIISAKITELEGN